MASPFKSLLPEEGRILLLHYEPLLPLCFSEGSESSEGEDELSMEESE